MKITKIDLKDFRAFAHEESFDLGAGKNVLLFGANGAGKSSLFRALKEMFNHTAPEPFANYKNIFTDPVLADGHIRLHFSQPPAAGVLNTPAEWPFAGPRAGGDLRITQGAIRLGALDYRSLLDTNYVFKDGEINLFDVLVAGILRPWLVRVGNRGLVTLGTLWDETLAKRTPTRDEQSAEKAAQGVRHFQWMNQMQWRIDAANESANIFNTALKNNLPQIVRRSNHMLRRLGLKGLFFNLTPARVSYDPHGRVFTPRSITIDVWFNRQKIKKPQIFLNEARLSAIALSLYLSSLLTVVPEDPTWPRVLVLDDVLIGLDMDNRLPVLDILRNEFRDWQVFLLTHDRTWFELSQLATEEDDRWVSFEMYPRRKSFYNNVLADVPAKEVVGDSPAEHFLERANHFFGNNDHRTASFYARAAFEAKLKGYCHDKKVQVAYDLTGRELTTDHFLDAIERRLTWSGKMPKARFMFNRIKMFRKGVLNPLAHFHPVTISPGEVKQAIAAVEALAFPADNAIAPQQANTLLQIVAPTDGDLLAAASWLRTAFEVDLRELLVRLSGAVVFRHDWNKLSHADLWAAAKAAINTSNGGLAGPLITDIEAHPIIFLNEFVYSTISILDKPALVAAWTALRDAAPANPPRTRLATFV